VARKSNGKTLDPLNRVHLVGVIASAMTSREGVLARRVEIPAPGAREIIDVECEKGEISKVFRGLRIDQWVEVEGQLRRRYWRDGARLASRTYVEVSRLKVR
jgi:hypothetical protein